MAHENPGLVDSSARARASVIHGLRRAPALLLVQGRGYTGKRIGQMCIASTLDGVLNRHRLERSRSEVDGGCNGQLGVANTVTFSEGIASSGEMQRSSIYGQETRTAFPYERKRASFDSRRRSVHVALENYGLNCPAPVSPSPMRSKSALGRALIPRTVRQLLFSSNDGQVDSLFDHEAEHFEFPTETEYRYLTHENALPSGVPTENILPSKRQSQIYNPGERITADIHVRSDLFDTCDNEGVAALGPIEEIAKADVEEAQSLLHKFKVTISKFIRDMDVDGVRNQQAIFTHRSFLDPA